MTTKKQAAAELLAAAKEIAAWPFKRRRAFLDRLDRAIESYERVTKGEHDDDGRDDGAQTQDPELETPEEGDPR